MLAGSLLHLPISPLARSKKSTRPVIGSKRYKRIDLLVDMIFRFPLESCIGGCVSSSPTVPPDSAGSSVAPVRQPLSLAKRALVALLMLLAMGLAVANALLWSRGVWNAEASGYAMGAILFRC